MQQPPDFRLFQAGGQDKEQDGIYRPLNQILHRSGHQKRQEGLARHHVYPQGSQKYIAHKHYGEFRCQDSWEGKLPLVKEQSINKDSQSLCQGIPREKGTAVI